MGRALRFATGVVICLLPVASLLVRPRPTSMFAVAALVPAALIAMTNAFLSLRRGDRSRSGIPLIATLIVVVIVPLVFGDRVVAIVSLAILGIDTGGAPWFLVATWRDRSLWH